LNDDVVVVKLETLENDERILLETVIGEPCFVDHAGGLDGVDKLIEE
jgi:hypothetical protein